MRFLNFLEKKNVAQETIELKYSWSNNIQNKMKTVIFIETLQEISNLIFKQIHYINI